MMALLITEGLEILPIQLGKYVKRLHRFHRSVQYAGPDIQLLGKEVKICQSLSLMFNESTKGIESLVKEKAWKTGVDQIIVQQTTEALGRIQTLLERLGPLHESANSSLVEKLVAVIRWNVYKQEIRIPIVILVSVKSSLQLLLAILMLDKNNSEIRTNSTLSENEREKRLSTGKMLRNDVQFHERTLEETIQQLKRQHAENENYHHSCVKKLSQIIDIMQEIKHEPILESRQLHGASPLSSPVSASSRQQSRSFHPGSREQTPSVGNHRSSVSNRRPRSRAPRSNRERPTGESRPSVHAQRSFNSRPNSRASRSASNSRALILRNHQDDQEDNRHSGDGNIYEEHENTLEIQPNALVLTTGDNSRNRRTSTSITSREEINQGYTVYHEYDDNSREIYTLSRAPSLVRISESCSESATPSENLFSSQTYIPMPPFDKTDLNKLRRRQMRRSKGQDGQE